MIIVLTASASRLHAALKLRKNTKKFEFECIFSGCKVILANARDHLAAGSEDAEKRHELSLGFPHTILILIQNMDPK